MRLRTLFFAKNVEGYYWIPACAGMTEREIMPLQNRYIFCVGSIEKVATHFVIPAQAGIQENLMVVRVLAIAFHRFAKKYLWVKVSA